MTCENQFKEPSVPGKPSSSAPSRFRRIARHLEPLDVLRTIRRCCVLALHRWMLKKSGLFYADWYLAKYPDVRSARLDPLRHYLVSGYLENRNPSPDFDTHWYLSHYSDVRLSGQNPLIHYIKYGRAEGRQTRPLGYSWAQPIPPTTANQSTAVSRSRIAVQVHLSSPEFAEELLNPILNVPGNVTALVTSTSDSGVEAAKAWAKKHHFNRLETKAVPNRGRNVAAFTSAFGKELLDRFDIFCHIHAERSIYAQDQSDYRAHHIKHLLGFPGHVKSVLNLMANHPNIGIIAPETYPETPYWTFNWLANVGAGQQLAGILGVPLELHGYIDYPNGCMFWARPSALKQLLDGRITLKDFPEEAGQKEGTLTHAVERALFQISRANGFHWVEVSAGTAPDWFNFSDRNLWQYRKRISYKSLINAIDQASTVSFDIFDTLITRIVPEPDDVFSMVQDKLDAQAGHPTNFRPLRKQAENDIRQSKTTGDVSLDEIYGRLASTYLPPDLTATARELEQSTEMQVMRPRKRMVEAFNHALQKGKRVILTSDMYLMTPQIDALLNSCGVSGYHKLYLSSEAGVRKDTGAMWRYLLEEEDAKSGGFLHIGDNEYSDVQLPDSLGIKVLHVLSPKNLFVLNTLGRRLTPGVNQEGRIPLSLGPIIASTYNDPCEGR